MSVTVTTGGSLPSEDVSTLVTPRRGWPSSSTRLPVSPLGAVTTVTSWKSSRLFTRASFGFPQVARYAALQHLHRLLHGVRVQSLLDLPAAVLVHVVGYQLDYGEAVQLEAGQGDV